MSLVLGPGGTIPGPTETGQEVCGQPLISGKRQSVPDAQPPPTPSSATAQHPLYPEIMPVPPSLQLSGLPEGQPRKRQAETLNFSTTAV